MEKTVLNLVIDSIVLALSLLLTLPFLTGLWIHEWGSVIIAVLLLVHLLIHADWCIATGRNFFGQTTAAAKRNFIVDCAALVMVIVVMVSGIMISAYVMPFFGFFGPDFYLWQPVHAVSAKLFLALVFVHTAMHWQWVYQAFKEQKRANGGKKQISDPILKGESNE